jgi:hypothetical protein
MLVVFLLLLCVYESIACYTESHNSTNTGEPEGTRRYIPPTICPGCSAGYFLASDGTCRGTFLSATSHFQCALTTSIMFAPVEVTGLEHPALVDEEVRTIKHAQVLLCYHISLSSLQQWRTKLFVFSRELRYR